MKHLMTSDKFMRAWCKRPGCIASLEGGIVENMKQKDLDNFFQSDCPAVPLKQDKSFKWRVNYLTKYAKKQIRDWEKLIEYWEKK